MNLSFAAYQALYDKDPNLEVIFRSASNGFERESLLSSYIKMTLLQRIPRNVALNLILNIHEKFNNKGKKVILTASCSICGCDPCDCEDWFGGSIK